ncbi:MAG: hypothetical protein Alpg2KO_09820 [Alphaproteobacteria bacterium]
MSDWLNQSNAAAREGKDPNKGVAKALSEKAVHKLHQRAAAKRQKMLENALPEGASDELRGALAKFISKATRARHDFKPSYLKELAGFGVTEIKRATRQISYEDFSRLQKVRQALARVQRPANLHDALFEGQDRRYFPLDQVAEKPCSDANIEITSWLTLQGYKEIDYIKGTCVDDRKNTRKIGRILRKDRPDLFEMFEADNSRAGLDKLLLVISRDPHDVARMSTNRGWFSCMGPMGMFWHKTLNDIAKGSIIAYVVKDSDPEINDPLARVLIKRFNKVRSIKDRLRGESSDFVLRASNTYGLGVQNLRETINRLLEETVNYGKHGTYKLQRGLYDDGWTEAEPFTIKPSIDLPADEYLKGIGIDFVQRDDGTILVNGDLSFKLEGLTVLPDLSNVEVTGDLNLAGNNMQTLAGAPYKVGGCVTLAGNPIRSFIGCPQEIGGDLRLGQYHDMLRLIRTAPEQECHSLDHLPESIGGRVNIYTNTHGHIYHDSMQDFAKRWTEDRQAISDLTDTTDRSAAKPGKPLAM